MRTRRMNGWRAAVTTVIAGTLGATGLAVLVPQVASADITLPADPAWVTNVSQGSQPRRRLQGEGPGQAGQHRATSAAASPRSRPNNEAFSPSGGQGGTPNSSGIDQPYLFADGRHDRRRARRLPAQAQRLRRGARGRPGRARTRVYVGGTFTSVNGSLQNGLAVLDATTGALRTDVNQQSLLNDAAPGSVWGLRLVGTKLYVGGNFTTVDSCGAADCNRGQARPLRHRHDERRLLQGATCRAARCRPSPSTRPARTSCTSAASSAGPSSSPAAVAAPTTPSWPPSTRPPACPGPGLASRRRPTPTRRPSHPRCATSRPTAALVYAAVGGGGGRFYVFNGDTTNDPALQAFNTDGDVQTLGLTADRTALFVGGHFTRINEPGQPGQRPLPDVLDHGTAAAPCAIQAQPNMSQRRSLRPLRRHRRQRRSTRGGAASSRRLLRATCRPYDPPDPRRCPGRRRAAPATRRTRSATRGSGGGIAHLRDNPHFVDTTPPATHRPASGVEPGHLQRHERGVDAGVDDPSRHRLLRAGHRVRGSASPTRWWRPSAATPPRSPSRRPSCSRTPSTSSRCAPSTSVTTSGARAPSRAATGPGRRSCPARCGASGSSPRCRRPCGSSTPASASAGRAPRRSPAACRSRCRSPARRPALSAPPGAVVLNVTVVGPIGGRLPHGLPERGQPCRTPRTSTSRRAGGAQPGDDEDRHGRAW